MAIFDKGWRSPVGLAIKVTSTDILKNSWGLRPGSLLVINSTLTKIWLEIRIVWADKYYSMLYSKPIQKFLIIVTGA